MTFGDRWCELDAAIHTALFKGGRLLGEAVCMAPDGPPWTVCPSYDVSQAEPCGPGGVRTVDGWEVRPVAVPADYDPADDADDPGPWKFGIPDYRLDVVPQYSLDISEAWRVVEVMTAKGFDTDVQVLPKAVPSHRAIVTFMRELDGGGKWTPYLRWAAVAEAVPEAICLAALKAIKESPQ